MQVLYLSISRMRFEICIRVGKSMNHKMMNNQKLQRILSILAIYSLISVIIYLIYFIKRGNVHETKSTAFINRVIVHERAYNFLNLGQYFPNNSYSLRTLQIPPSLLTQYEIL